MSFRSPARSCDLSRKFGCDPEDLLELARLARKLGIPVRGLSFHVGSQATDADKYIEAIGACTKLHRRGAAEKLAVLETLDIGGGFPVSYTKRHDIDAFCAPIREALAKLPRRLRVIAEPGRYISGPAAIGVSSVMGRARREGRWWYYLDDGLYGSYSGQLFDHAKYPVASLQEREEKFAVRAGRPDLRHHRRHRRNLMLPELKVGDLIVGAQWARTPGRAPRTSTSSPRRPSSP